jgi:hypothetical protein
MATENIEMNLDQLVERVDLNTLLLAATQISALGSMRSTFGERPFISHA